MMSCNRAIVFAALLLASIGASATDLSVTRFDDPVPNGCVPNDCSLREAVMTANILSGADRIILSAGIYQLTIAGAASDDASVGDLDIDTAIEIVGANATSTTILGANSNRIFQVAAGGGLTLRRVTLDHGRDNSVAGGGAILQNGALTIEDAIITGSQTNGFGGAIRVNGNDAVLRRVQLLNDGIAAGEECGTEVQGGCRSVGQEVVVLDGGADGTADGGAELVG